MTGLKKALEILYGEIVLRALAVALLLVLLFLLQRFDWAGWLVWSAWLGIVACAFTLLFWIERRRRKAS